MTPCARGIFQLAISNWCAYFPTKANKTWETKLNLGLGYQIDLVLILLFYQEILMNESKFVWIAGFREILLEIIF